MSPTEPCSEVGKTRDNAYLTFASDTLVPASSCMGTNAYAFTHNKVYLSKGFVREWEKGAN